METNNQLTTTGGQTPAFVQEKLASLHGALEYANVLLKSGIAPTHFYHKGVDGKPDYSKGKPEAVVIVLQFGSEIGMSPMQALQQLVPVNNLVSLKGDGAKALIQRSGKLATWQETEVGTQGKDDWGFKIEASRKDTGEKTSSTFTVADAKRAGLWIDEALLQRFPNMKHSPWYKHPRRMLKYRALGFISRDLFPDVLSGIYTEEEAADMNNDNSSQIVDGLAVDLSKEARTEQSNTVVAEAIEKREQKKRNLAGSTTPKVDLNKQEHPVTPAEAIPPAEEQSEKPAFDIPKYEAHLKSLAPKDLGKEFASLYDRNILPFSVQQWLDMGGSKLPKDLIMVMVAAHISSQELCKVLKTLGVNYNSEPGEAKVERNLSEQLEIMDQLEAAGADCDLIAASLNFPNKEEMLKFGDRDEILKLIA